MVFILLYISCLTFKGSGGAVVKHAPTDTQVGSIFEVHIHQK